MRDSFHDDHLLDRVMRERFRWMVEMCRTMSAEAVLAYIGEMRPTIVGEYRQAWRAKHGQAGRTADRQARL
jgi:hypothetical protein